MALVGLATPSALASVDRSMAATPHLMWLVLYLLVIIVAPVQHGLAVVSAGALPARIRSRPHLALNLAAIAGTVALFPAAIIWHAWPWFLIVPAGFAVGVRDMHYAGRTTATANEWEQEHLTSMISAGIALHTAFLYWPRPDGLASLAQAPGGSLRGCCRR